MVYNNYITGRHYGMTKSAHLYSLYYSYSSKQIYLYHIIIHKFKHKLFTRVNIIIIMATL